MKTSRAWNAMRPVLLMMFVLSLFVASQACTTPEPSDEKCKTNADCKKGEFCFKKGPGKSECRKLACSTNADCTTGEECKDGACVPGKVITEPTPTETTPDDASTPQEFTPTDSPDPCTGRKTCQDSGECGSGEKCVTGCCLPGCDANTPCPGGLKCKLDSGECVACLTNEDCGTKSLACTNNCNTDKVKQCISNQCVDAKCECPLGQKCSSTSNKCEFDKKCPDGKKPDANGKCPKPCENTQCPQGQGPDPDNNCACIPTKGTCDACTRDAECGPNGRCIQDANGTKYCAQDCSNSSCSDAGSNCQNFGSFKACIRPNGCPCLGKQCQNGQKCCPQTGACQECCDAKDCPSGQTCHNVLYTCKADKCQGVKCNPGQQCNQNTGKCDCPLQCPTGQCCDGTKGVCSAAACNASGCNPACTGANKCCDIGGQKQCLPQCPGGGQCTTDADCGSGKICCNLMGVMKSCMDGSNPIMKLLCGGGGGGKQCQTDADCPSGQKCNSLLPGVIPGTCQ